jgi:RimJ/RimL family protein N-acetyltransferase
MNAFNVAISHLEEARFEIPSARSSGVCAANVPELMKFCQENSIRFLIARCSAADLPAIHAMEREGFLLMDTLMHFTRDLEKSPLPELKTELLIRPCRTEDAEGVRGVAREAYDGYASHYSADSRLDPVKCRDLYVDWADRSMREKDAADLVLVADDDSSIAGFITFRIIEDRQARPLLGAVGRSYQRRGIYQSLLLQGMRWSLDQGARSVLAATQIQNVGMQKLLVRLGYEFSHALHTFHRWFDN